MDRPVRRIITGETPDGKGVFTHVEDVEPLRLPGNMLRYMTWGWEQTPTLPYHNDKPYEGKTGMPERRGAVQIETWVLPPHFPHEGGHENSDRMHSYDTVDIVFVLEGQIDLEQSDGVVVRLKVGDLLVQNGAVHTWRNPTDDPCVLGFVFFGAAREQRSDATAG